ncbi:hypothetical protein PG592_08870 [Riemerella anatipestifer]|uniref:hypothetical protein n=1 Tax=Riemerella anatipestifer TaxID=34085 RepID=UPI0007EDFAC4|nr:hypothetical protein [Riemerella anatipestifer]UIS73945.1 hypothetical protein [Riemerella phage vB_RanS_PT03]UUJ74610.1 hypothetical protein [Riemerella phage vB_RanS_PT15]UVK80322.1 hypothetical protein [Riemerella phage vB_RanS_PT33]WHL30563.1 hypothetical protein Henu10_gp60 [Shigella phage Henu10]WIR86134.1 hypothetical protein CRP12_000003 [Riemerella phage vB_RanS_CRP12]
MVIISKYLVPRGYTAMAVFPFIFLKNKKYQSNRYLLNHEKIHLRQQLELLILPFFVWYGLNYLWNLFRYKNHREAYRNIIFEREAYENQNDLEYLKNRKLWQIFNKRRTL